jgi:hypothetical protein
VRLVALVEGLLIVVGGGLPLTLVAFSILGTSLSPLLAALSMALIVVGIVVLRAASLLPRASAGARWTLVIFHVGVAALALVEIPLQPPEFWPVAAFLLLTAGVILHTLLLDADTAAAFRHVGALRSDAMTPGGMRTAGTSVARSAAGVAGVSGVVALSIVVAGVLLLFAFAAAVLLTWAHSGAG